MTGGIVKKLSPEVLFKSSVYFIYTVICLTYYGMLKDNHYSYYLLICLSFWH